jgi:ADP-ribose pyrophosphatase YjhB (NUDIX family)
LKDSPKTSIPREKWIPSELWVKVTKLVPLSCVDLILQRKDGSILYGFRQIKPYNGVWAFPGGRIIHGEDLVQGAHRVAAEYGLNFKELYLVGVFPVNFPTRADIAIALAGLKLSGEPIVDGFEFSSFLWSKQPPRKLGTNYRRMLLKWVQARTSADFLRLNRLQ